MARRRSNRLVVPNAGRALDQFKTDVMRREGYQAARPEQVKFEVARSLGIPLNPQYNGQLQTEDAGRIGGQIGGAMVRELVRMAQQSLTSGKAVLAATAAPTAHAATAAPAATAPPTATAQTSAPSAIGGGGTAGTASTVGSVGAAGVSATPYGSNAPIRGPQPGYGPRY